MLIITTPPVHGTRPSPAVSEPEGMHQNQEYACWSAMQAAGCRHHVIQVLSHDWPHLQRAPTEISLRSLAYTYLMSAVSEGSLLLCWQSRARFFEIVNAEHPRPFHLGERPGTPGHLVNHCETMLDSNARTQSVAIMTLTPWFELGDTTTL